jgi:hypothetical protein
MTTQTILLLRNLLDPALRRILDETTGKCISKELLLTLQRDLHVTCRSTIDTLVQRHQILQGSWDLQVSEYPTPHILLLLWWQEVSGLWESDSIHITLST